jgi:hypothetical protein
LAMLAADGASRSGKQVRVYSRLLTVSRLTHSWDKAG